MIMSDLQYEFFMSQIQLIRDIKEDEKVKISLVFYEILQAPCILKVCKNRNVTAVYQSLMPLRHPNLAIVYDAIYASPNTYIIEEWIGGKNLSEWLERKKVFTEKETVRIMQEVCKGLEVLHHHIPPIVHNDIKLSNIMEGEDGRIKLFDYDISRYYKDGATQNTRLFGTKDYASPEHFGFGQSEPSSDIFSLGITMHVMLTGQGLTLEHKSVYKGRLNRIIKKCIQIDRKKRYATASDLIWQFKRYNSKIGWILLIILVSLLLLFACVISIFLTAFTLDPGKYLGTELMVFMNFIRGVH